jgi:hypothetical protein
MQRRFVARGRAYEEEEEEGVERMTGVSMAHSLIRRDGSPSDVMVRQRTHVSLVAAADDIERVHNGLCDQRSERPTGHAKMSRDVLFRWK